MVTDAATSVTARTEVAVVSARPLTLSGSLTPTATTVAAGVTGSPRRISR